MMIDDKDSSIGTAVKVNYKGEMGHGSNSDGDIGRTFD